MDRKILYIFFGVLVSLSSCNKKDLDLEIVETACRDFFLSNPSYAYGTDSSCGSTSFDKTVNVTYNYEGDDECLFAARTSPKFYDIDGNELTDVSVESAEYLTSDGASTVSSGTATYNYCYHTTTASESALNYIQLDFHTENEQGNKSNEIGMRVNVPGALVKVPSSFDQEITIKNDTFSVFVFDDAAEDGDIISINVNQNWEIENKTILNEGETIQIVVQPLQTNFIMFYAVNQGSSGPNTLAGIINDGVGEQAFNVNLNTGETAYFKIILDTTP